MVAQHGDIWHSFTRGEEFAHKNQVLKDWCTQVGRDESQIERSVEAHGDPATEGQELLDAGVGQITVGVGDARGRLPLGTAQKWVSWRASL